MKKISSKLVAGVFAFAILCSSAVCTSAVEPTAVLSEDVEISSRFLELFRKEDKSVEGLSLIPGGDAFGIRIETGVYVEDVTAKELSGTVFAGDKIVSFDGEPIESVKDLMDALSKSGDTVVLGVCRGDGTFTVPVRPEVSDRQKKLGLTVKDTVSGIGTVSFIEPETGRFAGLGHGISTGEGKGLVPVTSSDVTEVILGGVSKGECGKPGELHGVLKTASVGKVTLNDECGVFGTLDKVPEREALPVANRNEVKAGDATVICTVKNGERAEYTVHLSEIDVNSHGTKSFTVTVTDPALIALTGGIVRGMSGSPILQNGKIVGALTHVTVAQPTKGYGIFAVNMFEVLDSAVKVAA